MNQPQPAPDDEPTPPAPPPSGLRYPVAPGLVIAGAMALFWWMSGGGVMLEWALSSQRLQQGDWYTLFTHMVAHGGGVHLLFNSLAFIGLSGPLVALFGRGLGGTLRLIGLFVVSALGGAATYLAINWDSAVPMLGASGGIFGMLGALMRLDPHEPRGYVAMNSPRMKEVAIQFIKLNAVLVLLLAVPQWLSGGGGMGLAWEAHLGGAFAGALALPLFMRR